MPRLIQESIRAPNGGEMSLKQSHNIIEILVDKFQGNTKIRNEYEDYETMELEADGLIPYY